MIRLIDKLRPIGIGATIAACMVLLLLLCFAFTAGGCAVGRNDASGQIVLGFDAGRLTESVNQGVAQLGDYILPGAGAALAAVGLPVLGWARSYAAARAATAAHKAADAGWDAREQHQASIDNEYHAGVVAASPALPRVVVAPGGGVDVPPPVAPANVAA